MQYQNADMHTQFVEDTRYIRNAYTTTFKTGPTLRPYHVILYIIGSLSIQFNRETFREQFRIRLLVSIDECTKVSIATLPEAAWATRHSRWLHMSVKDSKHRLVRSQGR